MPLLSPPFTASRAALRSALTIAARVVGDAGRPQLREAGFTSAAVPTGAFAAQAVFIASVGRHQPLLSFGEEAPPHGVPIPEPPSMYSQSLRSYRDSQDTLASTECWLIHHSCLTSLLPGEGKGCQNQLAGTFSGGEALRPCSLTLWPIWTL